jgi:hypothetical protein
MFAGLRQSKVARACFVTEQRDVGTSGDSSFGTSLEKPGRPSGELSPAIVSHCGKMPSVVESHTALSLSDVTSTPTKKEEVLTVIFFSYGGSSLPAAPAPPGTACCAGTCARYGSAPGHYDRGAFGPGNQDAMDYYVLPWIDMGGSRLRMGERHGVCLDAYRFARSAHVCA